MRIRIPGFNCLEELPGAVVRRERLSGSRGKYHTRADRARFTHSDWIYPDRNAAESLRRAIATVGAQCFARESV